MKRNSRPYLSGAFIRCDVILTCNKRISFFNVSRAPSLVVSFDQSRPSPPSSTEFSRELSRDSDSITRTVQKFKKKQKKNNPPIRFTVMRVLPMASRLAVAMATTTHFTQAPPPPTPPHRHFLFDAIGDSPQRRTSVSIPGARHRRRGSH